MQGNLCPVSALCVRCGGVVCTLRTLRRTPSQGGCVSAPRQSGSEDAAAGTEKSASGNQRIRPHRLHSVCGFVLIVCTLCAPPQSFNSRGRKVLVGGMDRANKFATVQPNQSELSNVSRTYLCVWCNSPSNTSHTPSGGCSCWNRISLFDLRSNDLCGWGHSPRSRSLARQRAQRRKSRSLLGSSSSGSGTVPPGSIPSRPVLVPTGAGRGS